MVFSFPLLAFIIIIFWLLGLSFFVYKAIYQYNNLTKGITQKNLKIVLENFIKDIDVAKKDIENIKIYCDKMQKEGLLHIQKVGLLRFNPFKDTGGDQSFILSLVNGKDTGVIISGLYSRSGTRWYAKRIVDGKSTDHELSEEEKRALKDAKS